MIKRFRVENLETNKTEIWTMGQVLYEINRDRSDQWWAYDETDYDEGWREWVQGEFYGKLEPIEEVKV